MLGASVKSDRLLAHVIFYKGWNHLWSVAEEARFYLLFPLVIALMVVLRSHLAKITCLTALIYLAYHFRALHKIDMLDGRFASFYFWMFLGGVLTCFLYKWHALKRVTSLPVVKLLLAIASLMVLAALFFSSDHMIAIFWRPVFPDMSTDLKLNGWNMPGLWFFLFLILFFSVTTYKENKASQFLQGYFLRHIGLLSYSLYLFHMPIFLNLRRFGFDSEGLFFTTLLISYITALISYVLIEKPFLMLKPAKRHGPN